MAICLDVSNRRMSDEQFAEVLRVLSNPGKVAKLYAQDSGIGNNRVDHLVAAIVLGGSVEEIWMAGNSIRDSGMKTISRLLVGNNVLRELHLGRNFFSPDGIRFLSDAILENSYLQILNVARCGLNYESAKMIVEAMTKSPCATDIYLGTNKLSGCDARRLCELAEYSPSLKLHGIGGELSARMKF